MKNADIQNWIIKAENDLKASRDLINSENPVTDSICFHAQQCVEKYLKAYLIYNGIGITKTHDITQLIENCIKIDNTFNYLYTIKADGLTIYAVEIRYPDDFYLPSIEEANDSIAIAEKVKYFVTDKLKNQGFIIHDQQ